jgi:hypothetical protein
MQVPIVPVVQSLTAVPGSKVQRSMMLRPVPDVPDVQIVQPLRSVQDVIG